MDNERPDELLYDYINGHATDAQIKEIMQWAHEDPANMKELELLRRLNDEAIWNASIDAEERQKHCKKKNCIMVNGCINNALGRFLSFLLVFSSKQTKSINICFCSVGPEVRTYIG